VARVIFDFDDTTQTHTMDIDMSHGTRSILRKVSTALLLMMAILPSLPLGAAEPPPQERLFVGKLLSANLRPTHDWMAESMRDHSNPHRSITIDLRCATATYTYAVLTTLHGASRHIKVNGNLGEWCDLPKGLDGMPVLVDIHRVDGIWLLKKAYSFELASSGPPILVPEGDPVLCGIRLWNLRSPLGLSQTPYVNDRTLHPKKLRKLMAQGVIGRDHNSQLVYLAGIRMQALLKALAASPCHLQPSDTE
jgi:hypothetical protein